MPSHMLSILGLGVNAEKYLRHRAAQIGYACSRLIWVNESPE